MYYIVKRKVLSTVSIKNTILLSYLIHVKVIIQQQIQLEPEYTIFKILDGINLIH